MNNINIGEKISKFRNQDGLTPLMGFPNNIMVELSNACNHSCVFCANRKMTRKKGIIDDKLMLRLIEEAYVLGSREIGFYTTGEPFVNTGLVNYIIKAKECGYNYSYITTNGALADENQIRAIVDAGIDSIKFSINACNKEMYNNIHGKNDWDAVIRNLKYASSIRGDIKRPFSLSISYVITNNNQDGIEQFYDEMSEYVDDILFNICGSQCGYMPENKGAVCTNTKLKINHFSISLPCAMIFKRAHVSCEGFLTMCCADYQNYLAVADLNKCSLKDAWNSDAFVNMRKKHLDGNVEGTLCYNCVNDSKLDVYPLRKDLSAIFNINNWKSS